MFNAVDVKQKVGLLAERKQGIEKIIIMMIERESINASRPTEQQRQHGGCVM